MLSKGGESVRENVHECLSGYQGFNDLDDQDSLTRSGWHLKQRCTHLLRLRPQRITEQGV